MARCIYADADIYFFDDCLSAVDANVQKQIFNSVIGKNGLLNNKTRVFVTNSLNFLPEMDSIIYIENGSIWEMGTYNELTKKDSLINKFTKHYFCPKEKSCNKKIGNDTWYMYSEIIIKVGRSVLLK